MENGTNGGESRNEVSENMAGDDASGWACKWVGRILHNQSKRVLEIELPDRDAAKAWIIKNQFSRRNLTMFQRSELALLLEPLVAKKAKEKQREHGGTAPGKKTLVQNSPQVKTRDEIAKAAGVSSNTIAKVKTIKAEGSLELVQEAEARRLGDRNSRLRRLLARKACTMLSVDLGWQQGEPADGLEVNMGNLGPLGPCRG